MKHTYLIFIPYITNDYEWQYIAPDLSYIYEILDYKKDEDEQEFDDVLEKSKLEIQRKYCNKNDYRRFIPLQYWCWLWYLPRQQQQQIIKV